MTLSLKGEREMAVVSKKNALHDLVYDFDNYTETNQDDFSRLCSRLMNENFIYLQIDSDRNDYYKISSMRDAISNYFSLMDYSLYHDDQFKIYYLVTDTGRNTVKFKKLDTIILLILRLFYYQKSKDSGNINIAVTVDELNSYIIKTGIYDQELKKGNLFDSLALLRRYKIVSFKGSDISLETSFVVFPTITHALTSSDMEALENKILSYHKTEDNEDEDM